MSKGIFDTLNIKSLEEIMAESTLGAEDEEEVLLPPTPPLSDSTALMSRAEMTNDEHSKKMDDVYSEAIEIARKVSDMGMNIDPIKAPRMFEVAGQHLKIAIDAQGSKRDAELKLMKLIQDQKKLDLEEMKIRNDIGDHSNLKGEVVMVEDRNKLLAQLKSQK